jgi:hypothetical protein
MSRIKSHASQEIEEDFATRLVLNSEERQVKSQYAKTT